MEGSATGLEGREVGRYRVVRELGSGGMATVYLARLEGEAGFGKWLALKVVRSELADDEVFTAMLLDEARVACRISHPNVCSVLDVGDYEGRPYLVMEHVHGQPLSRVLRAGWAVGAVTTRLAARVVADAARGLHAAHEQRGDDGVSLGVVHRDVCPQNLMVGFGGEVKVLDFGVARARGRLVKTRTGELKGHFAYMAPEQVKSAPVDRRTDVWALGVILWEATLGRRLFLGERDVQTTWNVVNKPIPAPRYLDRSFPAELETATLRALARDPAWRTATAKDLADGLERYLYATGEPFGASEVAEWMRERFPEEAAARPEDERSRT